MALTKCPECGIEVSSQAEACPKCAFPIGRTGPVRTKSNQTQLIEKTAKPFKAVGCVAALVSIAGVVMLMIGFGSEPQNPALGAIGFLMLLAGLLTFGLARILAWWSHG